MNSGPNGLSSNIDLNQTASNGVLEAGVNSTVDNQFGAYQLDALLGGYKWDVKTITYSFYDDDIPNSFYDFGEYFPTVSEVSEGIKNNVRTILKRFIEPFVDLKFVEVKDTRDSYGMIRYQLEDMSNDGGYAYAIYPLPDYYDTVSGDVFLSKQNDNGASYSGFQSGIGSYGFLALIHETLHALGLKHPGDYNGNGSGDPPFLPEGEDNNTNSVMTYNFAGSSPSTPMAYDIKALQHLYGAKQHNAGQTTYTFEWIGGFSDGQQFWGNSLEEAKVMVTKVALWDTGGIDLLDFSKLKEPGDSGYLIDLNPGGTITSNNAYNSASYKSRGSNNDTTYYTTAYGTVIAYDVTIENVINSIRDDIIIGNDAANTFSGYSTGVKTGNDTIVNANKLDRLDLSDYKAVDVSRTASGDNLVLGLGDNGTIILQDYYADKLGDRIQILIESNTVRGTEADDRLEGTGWTDLIKGLSGDDILQGLEGNDELMGGDDEDLLIGGDGNDVLSGDGDSLERDVNGLVRINPANEEGDDVLIGGSGQDLLIGWGDDILAGSTVSGIASNFADALEDEPFTTTFTPDGEIDTFVALNKDGVDYTLTIIDYELDSAGAAIDKIDLRGFEVRGVKDFVKVQAKDNFFEAKTGEVNGAELVLKINVNPDKLQYV